MSSLTKPQKLQLELLRMGSFNNLDGGAVADSLLENHDLWQGFIFDRAGYFAVYARQRGDNCDPIDLIKLRDIGQGDYNVDTLYILPAGTQNGRRAALLERLANKWSADEISWIDDPHCGRVLRVWWD